MRTPRGSLLVANCLIMAAIGWMRGGSIHVRWPGFIPHFYWRDEDGKAWSFLKEHDTGHCPFWLLYMGRVCRYRRMDYVLDADLDDGP